MKYVTEHVWRTDADEELIRQVDENYYVVPTYCSKFKLHELRDAITDILAKAAEADAREAIA